MAISRSWRGGATPTAIPHRIRIDEIPELNEVFSDAFTERYRRDGMAGVRVPHLNPAIWRYAIEDAAEGAMLWRDEGGRVMAFNVVHRSGTEGWMGPLAVRTDVQGRGWGKAIVTAGIEWLAAQHATVIGLETMPRTLDNIGFYSRLGFVPGHLTITVSLEAARADKELVSFSRMSAAARDAAIAETRLLVDGLAAGYDHSREILLSDALGLGDTFLLYDGSRLVGYALAHTAPLVEGRVRDELRVLKLVLDDEARFAAIAAGLADAARRLACRRVAFRLQGEYADAYRQVVALRGHVRWTDLRMSLTGHHDRKPDRGMVLSNWEI